MTAQVPSIVRLECYADIKKSMRDAIMAYYRQHPERFGDERSQRAVEESMAGLQHIFDILDGYDIRRKGEKP